MVTLLDNTPSQELLGDNKFETNTVLAAGIVTFPAGMLLGRITSSGKLTAYASGASDGSEVPIAFMRNELVTTGAGDTTLRVVIGGSVRLDFLLDYNAGTPHALTTAEIDAIRNFGIIAVVDHELRNFDNS